MNTKFIARLNWNGRKGWAVVKREGSRKTGFTETLQAGSECLEYRRMRKPV